MPTLSASDYTQYLKFKAAAASPIRPAIQTRANATLSQSVINANLLASQAALVTTPFVRNDVVQSAVVTDASSTTVITARTDVVDTATADGSKITYVTSQAHGLTDGSTITVGGFDGNLVPNPNRSGVVTVVNATTFTIPATGTVSGTATGDGSITNRVYYTTSVAHGLVAGTTVTITGLTTFNASEATIAATPTATTFVLTSGTIGTAETGTTATIAGRIYYTTSTAHGLGPGTTNVSVGGLPTSAFNLSLATVGATPTSTVFTLVSTATGGEAAGANGTLTLTFFGNRNTSITTNARVQGIQEVQTRSTNKAKSTLSWTSGMSGSVGSTSSSKFQQPGGQPLKGMVGTYTRLPQGAGWGPNAH